MRIYTKAGDKGQTKLCNGEKISKDSLIVGLYGDLDELNAHIGFVIAINKNEKINNILQKIQKDIFVLGANILRNSNNCKNSSRLTKSDNNENSAKKQKECSCEKNLERCQDPPSKFDKNNIDYLEQEIDKISGSLSPINRFILPSGSKTATSLHIARTVCRKAERTCVALSENREISKYAIPYLNRLSDLLFVLARYVNKSKDIFA